MALSSKLLITSMLKLFTLSFFCTLLIACSTKVVKTTAITPIIQETQEIAETELLDVGVLIFDPGLENIDELDEDEFVFAEVRTAESRYFPYLLVDALQQSSAWGAIRLIPNLQSTIDVIVGGKIIKSDGESMIISITVQDATGKNWFNKEYRETVSKYSYKKQSRANQQFKEPFQNIYNRIANDIFKYRKTMTSKHVENVRTVAELRFAQSFSPEVFSEYLNLEKSGKYQIIRLPAENDPMLKRIRQIRERDYLFIDTLQEYYAGFQEKMKTPYLQWRQESYQEIISLQSLKTSARNSKIAGIASILGGILAAGNSNAAARAAGSVAILGGAYIVKDGFDKEDESQIHVESLQELGDSLEASIAPHIIDLEDRTITLTGSVENQYKQWREILQEIYQINAETTNAIK